MRPQFIENSELDSFRAAHPHIRIYDEITSAVNELFDIAYPEKKDTKSEVEVKDYTLLLTPNIQTWGHWVYYEWLNAVVHFPPKDCLRALRTSRNRDLITAEEQTKLYSSCLLIVGMSVGSNIVEAIVSQGIGSKLILVDMDHIEPSNLNRIRSPYHHVGLHKVDAVSQKVWEIDPFIDIVAVKEGLDEDNLPKLLAEHQPNLIIDEMDSLKMKIILREYARHNKLPVLMAADDGDNSLVDIDRYDLNPDIELFNGQIPQEVLNSIKSGSLTRPEQGMIIGKYFVGPENIPLRMFRSLAQVGKTLPSWPQLGGAAALSGVVIAYLTRKILLGEKIIEGRALISLDEKLDLEKESTEHIEERQRFIRMM